MSLEGTKWLKAASIHWLFPPTSRFCSEIPLAARIWVWMTPGKRVSLMLNIILGIEWGKERERETRAGKGRGGEERILWWSVVGGQKEENHVGILCGKEVPENISMILLAQSRKCVLEYKNTDWQPVGWENDLWDPGYKRTKVCHFLLLHSSDLNQ